MLYTLIVKQFANKKKFGIIYILINKNLSSKLYIF